MCVRKARDCETREPRDAFITLTILNRSMINRREEIVLSLIESGARMMLFNLRKLMCACMRAYAKATNRVRASARIHAYIETQRRYRHTGICSVTR